MYKIVDSTFVFAVDHEITSVNLLPKVCSRYQLVATREVRSESKDERSKFPTEYIEVREFSSVEYRRIQETLLRLHP